MTAQTSPPPQIPIDRFEVFATNLDHPECVAFDRDGTILAGPFGYANGLALSLDERILFMVESNTNSVWRFDLTANKHEVFATETGWLPDGLALDEQQNLYVSCYASDDIHRITP